MQDNYLCSYVEKLFKICNNRLLRRKNTSLISYQVIRQGDIQNLVLSLKLRNIYKILSSVKKIIKKRRIIYSRKRIIPILLSSSYNLNYGDTNIFKKHVSKASTIVNPSRRRLRRRVPLRFTYGLLAKTPYFNSRTITATSHDILVKNMLVTENILFGIIPKRAAKNLCRIKKSHLFKSSIFKFVLASTKLKSIKQFMLFSLNKFITGNNVKILFNILGSHTINATFLAEYIVSRLKTDFPIRRLVKTTLKQMRKFNFRAQIKGFKIVCSGRFERRGRASYIWDTLGKVPNTNSKIKLDYITKLVTLTNSLCAVKI